LDPFRQQRSRIEERALIEWYRDLLTLVTTELRASNHRVAVGLAGVPEQIRGYEGIKHASAQASRERAEELVDLLRRPRLPLTSTTR
jgi:indolepyruvate ferredoxin oxidoreductase